MKAEVAIALALTFGPTPEPPAPVKPTPAVQLPAGCRCVSSTTDCGCVATYGACRCGESPAATPFHPPAGTRGTPAPGAATSPAPAPAPGFRPVAAPFPARTTTGVLWTAPFGGTSGCANGQCQSAGQIQRGGFFRR